MTLDTQLRVIGIWQRLQGYKRAAPRFRDYLQRAIDARIK